MDQLDMTNVRLLKDQKNPLFPCRFSDLGHNKSIAQQ